MRLKPSYRLDFDVFFVNEMQARRGARISGDKKAASHSRSGGDR
jgi:hypothetical protein